MKHFWSALACCVGILPLQALAAVEITGSYRNLSQLIESVPLVNPRTFLSANSFRLESAATLYRDIEAEIALENQWLYKSPQSSPLVLSSESPNTYFDATKTWRDNDRWSTRLHLDRFSLQGGSGALRWAIGRQPYGFGSIVLFSPLDVIAPFPPEIIDSEYRPGVDAVRVDLTTSPGDLYSAVAVFDDDAGKESYLATGSFNRGGVDLLLLGGTLRTRNMGGVGLAADLAGLGIKGELSWYKGEDAGVPGGDLYGDFPVAALELWYRFENDLIVLAEYLHNGGGAERPEEYVLALSSATYNEGLMTFLGRNYLLLAPSLELHPLLNLALLGIWNLDDDSFMVRPQVALSLGDNLSLELSHTINRGDEPVLNLAEAHIDPRSEFGTYGDSAALYLRWYF